jgi:AcrR family transcriptional regulator
MTAASPAVSAVVDPGRRLASARKGRARGGVSAIQRDRMIAAAVDALEDVGYARTTVSQVISRARVSRKTFYDLFDDREDCLLAAFEQMLAETRRPVEQAYREQADWRDAVRSALAALLEQLDRAPGLAKLFVVESLAGGERMLRRRAKVIDELARAIDRGRTTAAGRSQPMLTAQGLVGGVVAVLHTRLVRDDPEPFRALLGPLMSMIVLPYLGPAAAADEHTVGHGRQRRRQRRVRRRPVKDPLDGLKMRLTYRTMLVLAVVAPLPGASNREIAEGSGIVDQGQISKLLSRLAGLGLLENCGAGQPLGATNEWHLTARGAQLERATQRR